MCELKVVVRSWEFGGDDELWMEMVEFWRLVFGEDLYYVSRVG